MSLKVRDLSIADLLRLLGEKLDLECTRLRGTCLAPTVSPSLLKSEIGSLETKAYDVLRLIPSLRNALQPVNRLPPEILSRIVRYVPNYCAVDASSVVPLTHVCRYWREVIISTPSHWTSISNKSRSLAAVSLERAKSAPLKITLNPSPSRGDHPLSGLLIPSYIQNTKTLSLDRLSVVKLKNILPNFPNRCPISDR